MWLVPSCLECLPSANSHVCLPYLSLSTRYVSRSSQRVLGKGPIRSPLPAVLIRAWSPLPALSLGSSTRDSGDVPSFASFSDA